MTDVDDASGPPWQGQAYSAKRHGVTITNCDTEPVQTPGCIQSHGALLVLRRADLTITQVSENAEQWLGQGPPALLGAFVATVVGETGQAAIAGAVQAAVADGNPNYLCTLPQHGTRPALDVTVHTSGGAVIVELEACRRLEAFGGYDPYCYRARSVMDGRQVSRGLFDGDAPGRYGRPLTDADWAISAATA